MTQPGVDGKITFRADGSWKMTGTLEMEGEKESLASEGTWKVVDGAIHNVTTKAESKIPGMPALPYTSIEKLVSVNEHEYRYVCPAQGCTNRMVKVAR